ncbi:MAG: hypothetical protein E6J68_13510 [Deltaproteobacteria bacterium]|nr:MAG: hypothetical protein E6J68_13510 [Deltaproteobacteria bacterium]
MRGPVGLAGAGFMSSPSAHGLAWASYGSDPSLHPVQAAGEQLAHDVSISARLFFATQSPAPNPSTRPAYSHQPLPGAQEEPKPAIASPSLQAVSKLVKPTTLYLLLPSASTMPWMVTTPAMRFCTPQSVLPTPPGPTLAATSNATRAPLLWPIRTMFDAGAG